MVCSVRFCLEGGFHLMRSRGQTSGERFSADHPLWQLGSKRLRSAAVRGEYCVVYRMETVLRELWYCNFPSHYMSLVL